MGYASWQCIGKMPRGAAKIVDHAELLATASDKFFEQVTGEKNLDRRGFPRVVVGSHGDLWILQPNDSEIAVEKLVDIARLLRAYCIFIQSRKEPA